MHKFKLNIRDYIIRYDILYQVRVQTEVRTMNDLKNKNKKLLNFENLSDRFKRNERNFLINNSNIIFFPLSSILNTKKLL